MCRFSSVFYLSLSGCCNIQMQLKSIELIEMVQQYNVKE